MSYFSFYIEQVFFFNTDVFIIIVLGTFQTHANVFVLLVTVEAIPTVDFIYMTLHHITN